ncbi:NHL domain-containing thioredoxin family protein [Brachybacterium paraconglomeratum]|uniref:NHL domain-containing thioredoxin family protein n=1 Tax=Brachybacterium paraconglomeratum TaxID=173362 RepID=UPI0022AE585B|nr:NHL domain-containing thioredoxin family protein [Brachybacterium paraconglomeratum]MCZ4325186.1 thioredoxin-like domain-containing protein [Brachybacterium paraconglomeratum]
MTTSSDPSAPLTSRAHGSPLRGRGWLNTGGAELDLETLRGKIVLLDFWTFCCVNCLHVLDELRPLEEKWADELVVIGVHSPKFEFEKDPEALQANIERYEVSHPVIDDPELKTWSAYGARAWPTLMVLDTHGRIAGNLSGEGHAANLDRLVAELVAEGEADGSLRRGPAPTVLAERSEQTLRFPSKLAVLRDGRLVVSDAGQHRLVVFQADGATVDAIIGTGERGHADGDEDTAQFAEPNGVLALPAEVAQEVGYDLLVADTAGHRLRGVKIGQDRLLRSRTTTEVVTVAGTGEQWMQGEPLPRGEGDARTYSLSTPWDLTWSHSLNRAVIAMAGIHQLWTYDPVTGALLVLAGTTQEGLVDGPAVTSWWAQPSGLDEMPDGRIVIADSESSAVRLLDPQTMQVSTLVGKGLFDFGHVDGSLDRARLQHPLGVTALPDGRIAIADTYNGAIRLLDEETGEVVTVATDLKEPSDAIVGPPVDGIGQLIVVESGAHRITWVPVAKAAERVIDEGAQRSERPATEVGPGPLTVRVLFTPPPGHKLDDSLGPSTQVTIATTPTSMLTGGGGVDTALERTVTLDPAYTEGVLHVSARAASCDADPAVEFPACHMHQQDWGVPIRVVEGGPDHLDLSLLA